MPCILPSRKYTCVYSTLIGGVLGFKITSLIQAFVCYCIAVTLKSLCKRCYLKPKYTTNGGKLDEWLAICQNFPYRSSSLNASPLKPISNLLKFCLPKFVNGLFIKLFPCQAIRTISLLTDNKALGGQTLT